MKKQFNQSFFSYLDGYLNEVSNDLTLKVFGKKNRYIK